MTTLQDVLWMADGSSEPADPAASGAGGMNFMLIIFIVGMVAVMWFMSRRNKKQQQKQADFRDSLEPGQRVMTAGGMVGVVSDVEGDVVTIMSPGGDQSAYVRRAIRSQVTDEEWEAMLQPYPIDEEDEDEADGEIPEEDAELDSDEADAADDEADEEETEAQDK